MDQVPNNGHPRASPDFIRQQPEYKAILFRKSLPSYSVSYALSHLKTPAGGNLIIPGSIRGPTSQAPYKSEPPRNTNTLNHNHHHALQSVSDLHEQFPFPGQKATPMSKIRRPKTCPPSTNQTSGILRSANQSYTCIRPGTGNITMQQEEGSETKCSDTGTCSRIRLSGCDRKLSRKESKTTLLCQKIVRKIISRPKTANAGMPYSLQDTKLGGSGSDTDKDSDSAVQINYEIPLSRQIEIGKEEPEKEILDENSIISDTRPICRRPDGENVSFSGPDIDKQIESQTNDSVDVSDEWHSHSASRTNKPGISIRETPGDSLHELASNSLPEDRKDLMTGSERKESILVRDQCRPMEKTERKVTSFSDFNERGGTDTYSSALNNASESIMETMASMSNEPDPESISITPYTNAEHCKSCDQESIPDKIIDICPIKCINDIYTCTNKTDTPCKPLLKRTQSAGSIKPPRLGQTSSSSRVEFAPSSGYDAKLEKSAVYLHSQNKTFTKASQYMEGHSRGLSVLNVHYSQTNTGYNDRIIFSDLLKSAHVSNGVIGDSVFTMERRLYNRRRDPARCTTFYDRFKSTAASATTNERTGVTKGNNSNNSPVEGQLRRSKSASDASSRPKRMTRETTNNGGSSRMGRTVADKQKARKERIQMKKERLEMGYTPRMTSLKVPTPEDIDLMLMSCRYLRVQPCKQPWLYDAAETLAPQSK